MLVALLSSLLLSLSAASASTPTSLLVSTTQGLLQGHLNEVGVAEWKGVPYAKPPVSERRWAYPEPVDKLADGQVYQANFEASGCPQDCKLPPGNCPTHGVSEDCLYLTVYAPPTVSADGKGYPVLFWIHGGAFEQGLGNCALYNGSTLAAQNVITVVINYRLGALGFMASKSMQGNYGFMDQRLAMQWTKDNIAAFGGDPSRITIAGQSAGAMSVGSHLISPGSAGLFANAIQESNPLGLPFHTKASAAKNADDVFAYLGCASDDVACMRGKTADEIVDAQNHAIKLDFDTLLLNFLPFAPMVVPGGEIPEQPLYAMAAGEFKTMAPMLSGSVYDEGQLFVYELFTKPVTEATYKIIIDGVFGLRSGKKVLEMYPFDIVPGSTDGREALNVLATDLLFYCPLRNITRGYQQSISASALPTYIYRFKHVISFDCWGPDYPFCVGEVCHGSELPFVFNVFSDGAGITYTPTADETQLAVDLTNAWANFVSTGNPNKGYPVPRAYPLYETSTDMLVVQEEPDDASYTQSHVRDEYCNMWDAMGYFF